ncbi:MAG: hypothetical protein HKL87_01965 [Acidimicrobiaceae bacterium]|nr:hypothetical protein [Acidimicrobiaceae bacterium]
MSQPTPTQPRQGLTSIAREDGTFAVVAMDQRNTLKRMLAAVDRPTTPEEMREFKVDVTGALSPLASAVLLDPEFGVSAVKEADAMAPGCAYLVAAEPPERDTYNGEPRATRDPARNAQWVKDMGGDAVKFLVQLRPDRPRGAGEPDLVQEVVDVVSAVVADCRAVGIPSVVETLLYSLPGEEPLSNRRRAELIVESARILNECEPDLLKLEFPSDAQGCRGVAEVVTGPWAMLSAGMPLENFLDAIQLACDEGGASGFIAGRVYWKEAVALAGEDRRHFLGGDARSRFQASLAAMAGRARPWTDFF